MCRQDGSAPSFPPQFQHPVGSDNQDRFTMPYFANVKETCSEANVALLNLIRAADNSGTRGSVGTAPGEIQTRRPTRPTV